MVFGNLFRNKHLQRDILSVLPLALWGGLGYYRGVHSYNHHYSKKLTSWENNNNNNIKYNLFEKRPEQFYISKMGLGIAGTCLYVTPFTGIFMATKELWRLEVNLRGLKEEKDTDSYQYLI